MVAVRTCPSRAAASHTYTWCKNQYIGLSL